ncbi:putative cell wall binding repeat 2 [Umbribacter vaginalis]|nr:putative cell wall binding repeat 2 [Coriobacteriales bacterium DNF00809]
MINDYFERSNSLENNENCSLSAKSKARWGRAHAQKRLKRHVATSAVLSATLALSMASPAFAALEHSNAASGVSQTRDTRSSSDTSSAGNAASEQTIQQIKDIADKLFKNETIIPYLMGTGYIKTAEGTNYDVAVPNDKLKYIGGKQYLNDATRIAPGLIEDAVFYQILSEAARAIEKAPRVTENEARNFLDTLKGILLTYGVKDKTSLQDDGEYLLLSKAKNAYNVKFQEMQQAEYGSNIYVPTGKENTQAKELFARAELVKWGNYLDLNFLTDSTKVRNVSLVYMEPFLNKRFNTELGHVGNSTSADGIQDVGNNIFTVQIPGEFSATQLMCTIKYTDAQGKERKVGPVGIDIDYDAVNKAPNIHSDGHNYISSEYDEQTKARLSYWIVRGEAILKGLDRNNAEHKQRIDEINKAIQEIKENLKQPRPSYTKALASAVPIYKTEIAFAISNHLTDVVTSHRTMLAEKNIINEKKYTKESIETYKQKLNEYDAEASKHILDISKLLKDIKVLDDATTGSILEYNASRLENIVKQVANLKETDYDMRSYYAYKIALDDAQNWLKTIKRRPPLDETADYTSKLLTALGALKGKQGEDKPFTVTEPQTPGTSGETQQQDEAVVDVALNIKPDAGSFVVPNFYEPQGKLDKKNHTLTIYLTKEAEDKVKQIDYSGAGSVQTTAKVTTEGDRKVIVLTNYRLNSSNAIPADIAFTVNGVTKWNNASTIAFTELAAIKKEKQTVKARLEALKNEYTKKGDDNVLSILILPDTQHNKFTIAQDLEPLIPDVLISRSLNVAKKVTTVCTTLEKDSTLTDEQRMNHIDTAEDMLKTCNQVLRPYNELFKQISAAKTRVAALQKSEQEKKAAYNYIDEIQRNFKAAIWWKDTDFKKAKDELEHIEQKAIVTTQASNQYQAAVQELITKAQALLKEKENNKFPENTQLMYAAITQAMNAVQTVDSKQKQDDVTKALQSAMDAFSNSINASDISTLKTQEVKELVKTASKLEMGNHPAGAWAVLQAQINATRDMLARADSQDAVETAKKQLEQQIAKFNSSTKSAVTPLVAGKSFAEATYVIPDRTSDHAFLNAAVWSIAKISYDGSAYNAVLTLKPALDRQGMPYAATTKVEYSYNGTDWKSATTLTSDQNVLPDYSNNTYVTSISVPLIADNVLNDKPVHIRVTYVERIEDQRDNAAHNETKLDTADVIFDSQTLAEYKPLHDTIDLKKLVQAYNAQQYGVNTQIAEQSVVEKAKKLIANPDTVSDVQETTLLLRHGNAKQPVKKTKEWLDAASAMAVVLKTAQNFTQDASFKKLPPEKQQAFIASIEEATKYILADSTHSKDELDAKREALNSLYNELVEKTGVVTLSPLESMLGKANKIQQGRKSDDAWNVFKSALFEVQTQYSKWSIALPTSQEIVAKEVNKLESAINTFNSTSDEALNLDELKNDITSARNLLAASPAAPHMQQMLNQAISAAEQFLKNVDNSTSKADLRYQLTLLQNAVQNYKRSLSLTPNPGPSPQPGPGGSGTQPGGGTENPPAPGPGPNPQNPQDKQEYTVSLFVKNKDKNALSAADPCVYWRGVLDQANNKMYLSLTLVPMLSNNQNTPGKYNVLGGITNLEYQVPSGGAWKAMNLSTNDLRNIPQYNFSASAKGYTYPSGASLELPADAIASNRDTVIPIRVHYFADGLGVSEAEALLYVSGDTLTTKVHNEYWSYSRKHLVSQRAFIKMNKIPITVEAMKNAVNDERNYALSSVNAMRAYGRLLLATADALKTYPTYKNASDANRSKLDTLYQQLKPLCVANSQATEQQIATIAGDFKAVSSLIVEAMEANGSLLSQSGTAKGVGTPWYEAAPEPNPSVPGGSDPSVPTPPPAPFPSIPVPPAPIPGGQGGGSQGGTPEGGSQGGGTQGGSGEQTPEAPGIASLANNPLQQQVLDTERDLVPLTAKQFAPVVEATHPVKPFEQVTNRVAGDTAMETMSKVIDETFNKARTVVLASKDGYWDALSASALAGALKAPVLLSGRDALPQETIDQLQRLGTKRAYLVGGRSVMSNSVVDQLHALGISTVTVAGKRAQDTSNMVARKLPSSDVCFIATSWGYQDALSASSFAYAKKAPIFLANDAGMLDRSTLACIRSKNFKRVVLIGGESVLAPALVQQLNQAGVKNIQRIAGETAYDTSALFAQWALNHGMRANNMAIATGYGYEDALVGAALCGKKGSVMVLADDSNTTAVDLIVDAQKNKISNYYILGGQSVVGERVSEGLENVFSSFGDDVNAADSADGASLEADINDTHDSDNSQSSSTPATSENIEADINED